MINEQETKAWLGIDDYLLLLVCNDLELQVGLLIPSIMLFPGNGVPSTTCLWGTLEC